MEPTPDVEDKSAEIREFARIIGLDTAAPGRYSGLLLLELYAETILMRRMNPAKVIHEILNLEAGIPSSGTKAPTQFNRAPLRGLWHKHYLQDGLPSMAMNLKNALEQHGIPLFEQRIREAQEAGEERYVTPEDVKALAHDVVVGNWLRRADANKLTGEWIIYAQHDGKNYYLCLGKHDSGDDILRNQIDEFCCKEFPFLTTLLV